eukprot:scaffold510685_cov15-Prasinocladus_malaysianus.AAC.1
MAPLYPGHRHARDKVREGQKQSRHPKTLNIVTGQKQSRHSPPYYTIMPIIPSPCPIICLCHIGHPSVESFCSACQVGRALNNTYLIPAFVTYPNRAHD